MNTPLPDACCVDGPDGHVLLAANKKARLVLNKTFEKPRPRWNGIANTPGPPEYRATETERGPGLCALIWALHEAGCTSMYWCESCNRLHPVDDKAAEAFKYMAVSGAAGVMPAHGTTQ